MKAFVGRAAVTVAVCMSVPTMAFAQTVLVTPGDTLWGIAQAHHVSVQSLETANHLHTTTLQLGQHLVIPGTSQGSYAKTTSSRTSNVSETNRVIVVTVKKGDTISGIAASYGASTEATLKLNGLTSRSVIHIGQKIKVATGTTRTSSRGENSPVNLGTALRGVNIANFAKQFIGVPYRWGGTSASGFDCSGFVLFVYAHFGIDLGRTSYSQADEGRATSRANPNIGDLVFFDTDGSGASHVGIYLGNGEFINAEDRGVRIDSLYSGYWASHYLYARTY